MIVRRMSARKANVVSHYIEDARHAAENGTFGPKVIASGVGNVESDDWAAAAEELAEVEAAYSGRGRACDHLILTWREGEHPSPAQMAEAASIAVRHAGYENQPYVWTAHGNTDNIHIHINVLRIEMDDSGRLRVPDGRATIRTRGGHDNVVESLHVALAEICRDQGWQPEANARYGPDLKRASKKAYARDKDEIKLRPRLLAWEAHHPGQKHPIRLMGEAARDIIRAAQSWAEANARLAEAGITITAKKRERDGEILGGALSGPAGNLKWSALPEDCWGAALARRFGIGDEPPQAAAPQASSRGAARQRKRQERRQKQEILAWHSKMRADRHREFASDRLFQPRKPYQQPLQPYQPKGEKYEYADEARWGALSSETRVQPAL